MEPTPSPLRSHWTLAGEVTFLNHGSFGACPRAVLAYQSELRARLEAEPVHFFVREYGPLLDEARHKVAAFVAADPDGLAFVPNATSGVNAVLRSLPLQPGDELLVTDHEYNACRNVLDFVAERTGARVVLVRVPFPLQDEDAVVDAVLAAAGPRTTLLLIDHVTSATGLVLPLERIVPELRERGIETLVDGAHAPGMVPLDLDSLGAAYYTGNAHKWLCAPKGAAVLWVRKDLRAQVRPAVISHGANIPTHDRPRFRHEFDWVGTMDPTPWLCIPEAIDVMASLLPGGWPAIMRHNRDLALNARTLLCAALETPPPAPAAMIASLASIPLPDGAANPAAALYIDPLQQRLWDSHRIEVPVTPWPAPPKRLLRISAQIYNRLDEYETLARALPPMIREEGSDRRQP
jgi:isopenicillin-N epimerase